jgi:hypothetical protein
MDSILISTPAMHFVAGLALVALAVMAGVAMRRAASDQTRGWGLLALIVLGLAQWCELPMMPPVTLQFARAALELLALVALVEMGLRCVTSPRGGLLPRFGSLLLAALTVVAALLAKLSWAELACQAALCWQAAWLAKNYLPAKPIMEKTIVGALLTYLGVGCLGLPSLEMVAALAALSAGHLAFGPRAESSRPAKLLWRCSWPAAFAVIAISGCLVLPTAGNTETNLLMAEVIKPENSGTASARANADQPAAQQLAIEQPLADADEEMDFEPSSEFARQARRYGLGFGPIVLFVLLVWGLSRLPFMH